MHQVKLCVISDAVDRVFARRMKMKLNQLVDVSRLRSDVKVAGGIVGHFDIVAGILDLQRSRLVLEQRWGKVRYKCVGGNDVDRRLLHSDLTRDAVAAVGIRWRHVTPVQGTDGRSGVVIPCLRRGKTRESQNSHHHCKKRFHTPPRELN